jgi:hypothetical protein
MKKLLFFATNQKMRAADCCERIKPYNLHFKPKVAAHKFGCGSWLQSFNFDESLQF